VTKHSISPTTNDSLKHIWAVGVIEHLTCTVLHYCIVRNQEAHFLLTLGVSLTDHCPVSCSLTARETCDDYKV